MTAAQIVGWALTGLTTVGGLSWLISAWTVRANREKILAEAGKIDADAAEVIKKSALTMVAEMQEDSREARAVAREAWAETRATRAEVGRLDAKVAELSHQLDEAISEGQAALAAFRTLKVAILDPAATIGSLRDLVTRSARSGMPP